MTATRTLFDRAPGAFQTVVPELGESFRALLYRVADAFGLASVTPVLEACSQGGPRPFSRASLPAVAELCGVPVDHLSLLAGVDADYVAGRSEWRFERAVVTHFPAVNCRDLPYCPECLRATGLIRGYVHLRAATACPSHRCRLVYNCVACGRPLTATRRRLSRCNCGTDLLETTPVAASEEELLVTQAVIAIMSGTGLSSPVTLPTSRGTLDLTALSLDQLAYLHWGIGHALCEPRLRCMGTRHRLTPCESISAVRRCVSVLRDPTKLNEICSPWLSVARRVEAEELRPVWFVREVLVKTLATPGLGSLVRHIDPVLLKRPTDRRRGRPGGVRPVQLELPYEAAHA